jgi:hypothetical protein
MRIKIQLRNWSYVKTFQCRSIFDGHLDPDSYSECVSRIIGMSRILIWPNPADLKVGYQISF